MMVRETLDITSNWVRSIMVMHLAFNQLTVGSSPTGPTKYIKMNTKQKKTYDKWVKQNQKTYPIHKIIIHRSPMTHVSIFASRYYDVNPTEVAQINEHGILT